MVKDAAPNPSWHWPTYEGYWCVILHLYHRLHLLLVLETQMWPLFVFKRCGFERKGWSGVGGWQWQRGFYSLEWGDLAGSPVVELNTNMGWKYKARLCIFVWLPPFSYLQEWKNAQEIAIRSHSALKSPQIDSLKQPGDREMKGKLPATRNGLYFNIYTVCIT